MNEQERKARVRELYDELVAHIDEIQERLEQEKEKEQEKEL